jgi:hypothetical protein
MFYLHRETVGRGSWCLAPPHNILFITGRDKETGGQRIALVDLKSDSTSEVKLIGPIAQRPGHAAAWEAFREMIDERVMEQAGLDLNGVAQRFNR